MGRIEVKKNIKNELFRRQEIELVVETEKTPSFAEAAKIVSEQFKVPEGLIVIEGIKGKFGRKTFLLTASIYDNKELKEAAVKKLAKKTAEKSETKQ